MSFPAVAKEEAELESPSPKSAEEVAQLFPNIFNASVIFDASLALMLYVFAWGGCHGADDKEAVFEGIILHADVASMYPTTDIEYGLLSRKFKNPDDFKQMRDFRLKLKSEKNPKNKALKPMINGVYGAGKDRNNPSYDPLMANLTCIFGQMFILDLIDKLEPYCRLLQTNTDGIFVLCENEEMKNKVIEITNQVGKTPYILFDCMNQSSTFYEFLKKCLEKKITKKVLEQYLIADCCNIYGKTKKLLTFIILKILII